jgi:hypothetical protein
MFVAAGRDRSRRVGGHREIITDTKTVLRGYPQALSRDIDIEPVKMGETTPIA